MSKHLSIHHLCAGLIVTGMMLCAPPAWGQRTSLPLTTLSTSNADAVRPEVTTFVKDAVTKIESDDNAAQRAGRDSLVDAANSANASSVFLDIFAQVLNDQLIATGISDKQDLRCRLNAAIAVARVAGKAAAKSPNSRLEPITEKLVQDKSQPVCLWGLKAAGPILTSLLVAGQPTRTLAQMVVDAVKAHADCSECGTTVEEAYNALTLNGNPNSVKGVSKEAMKAFAPYAMQLLAWRTSQYETAVPSSPAADNEGTKFLVADSVWSTLDVKQRSQILKLLEDFLDGSQKQLAQATEGKKEICDAIRNTGEAFQITGGLLHSDELTNAGINVRKIGNDPSPGDLTSKIDAVKTAVRAVGLPTPTPVAG